MTYSFFAKATFEERRSMRRHRAGDADRDLAVQQYLRRSWSVFFYPSTISIALQLQDRAFPLGPRYVATTCAGRSCTQSSSSRLDSWKPTLRFMTMSAEIIPTLVPFVMASPELKFRYTSSPNELTIVKDRIWPYVLSLKTLGVTRYVYNLWLPCSSISDY